LYLKSLTVRGFKSFASSTTLHFEPGITCVVGPNGSGKSNVVDAISWVMGEQGAKSLRGGKMEDVIFAGTAQRAPLGRAEVILTIDNTDGALPIDYTEVTISRIMFRNGGSEYAINGSACRLLDVQELLSDSGIGREMHVIVGQGQLDAVLRATPEERRGFVEEAAGVLKHRKRKEKAIRKLDATQTNLNRLSDLLTELRRALKPLGRQAEVARRAAGIQSTVRDARLRLLADELARVGGDLERDGAAEQRARDERATVEAALAEVTAISSVEEESARADAPALAAAGDLFFGLSAVAERIRGIRGLAAERARQGEAEIADAGTRQGRDPDQLDADAARAAEAEAAMRVELERLQVALDQAVTGRDAAERAHAAEDRRVAGLLRAAADRREGLARLAGQVQAVTERLGAREVQLARLRGQHASAVAAAADATREFTAAETLVAGLDAGEEGLDTEHEQAVARLSSVEDQLAEIADAERTGERDRAGLVARVEALELAATRRDGAGALLAAGDAVSGLLGSVAALVQVEPGWEAAVAAGLGEAADAVAVGSLEDAFDALARLKSDGAGRSGLVVAARPGDSTGTAGWGDAPAGTRWLADVVEATGPVAATLADLIRGIAVTDDLDTARAALHARPDVRVVTRAGDVVGARMLVGGSAEAPTLLEVTAALDEARRKLDAAEHELSRHRFAGSRLRREREEAAAAVEDTLARLHESDAELAALAEQLGNRSTLALAARRDTERALRAVAEAEAAQAADEAAAQSLRDRLAAAEDAGHEDPSTDLRDELADAARAGRAAEMEARLSLRTAEERGSALIGRADALRRAAAAERAARVRAAGAAERRRRQARIGAEVVADADRVLARLSLSIEAAAAARVAAEKARADRDATLVELRRRARDLSARLELLTDAVHRDELARAEQRLRLEALRDRALAELGVEPDTLVQEYGPDQPVPVEPDSAPAADTDAEADAATGPATVPFVRAEQEKRLRTAERELAQLGRVNPLALEEFAAMEERHQFLSEQLEDLRKTREDLLGIVKEVDERVEQVFAEAFADTAREFEAVIPRLFPGGEGKLLLTEPGDLLHTGVEVEARPAGKKVKRLSLLSGGERSLVAVAFLVALFKARPSPFYILDEVEAALDDANLGRLLDIYEELRINSQLLVITHQKRTMEVADALYGVTMRGDGVSAVISQRLRDGHPEVEPEPAAV
jgi:chromosome segregation protein